MADDINKKITLDVQVNSDGLQQLDKYSGAVTDLNAAVANLAEGVSKAQKNIDTISESATKITTDGAKQVQQANNIINGFIKSLKSFGETIGTVFSTGFKNIFSNVEGYYKKPLKKGTDAAVQANKQTNTAIEQSTKASQDKIRASEIESAQKTSDAVFNIITKGIDERRDAQVRGLEDQRKAIDNNTSLEASDKKTKENNIYKLEDTAKRNAFKQEQKYNIAQAIMNGAMAVTKAEAELGPIAGTIALAAIVAQTASQIATIEAQQPPAKLATYAKGGYFRSDGKGAVLPGYSRSDNTNAHLRSGEGVVVSEAMRDPWARNMVSAINVAYGGRDFSVPAYSKGYAVGGIFTDGGNANRYYNQPVNDNKNLANTIAYQMINNFPPVYVDVKDINNQQNIMAQTVNRVNL